MAHRQPSHQGAGNTGVRNRQQANPARSVKESWATFLRRTVVLLSCALALIGGLAPRAAHAFETGADMSECEWEQASEGVVFKNGSGGKVDPVAYGKSNGWTCCRLRLLVDSSGGALSQNLSYDLAMASRIKGSGMKLLLDIFYSDQWCDPNEQTTPPEWADENYSQLKATVQSYTASVITSFKNNGTLPDYVQIGNEISNGMLWPVGSLSNQSQFIGLIQAGIAGVKQVSGTPKIILHCNGAADTSLVEWFYNTIASQCNYDIVGLSYYPANGTNLSDITSAMNAYKGKFGNRPIMLVEFGYQYADGFTGSGGYWNTPVGQQQIVYALVNLMKGYSQGDGVLYWGATYVTGSWGDESLYNYSTYDAEPAQGSL